MKHPWLLAIPLACLCGTVTARAQDPVPGAGRMEDVAGAHETPSSRQDYRIVFDVRRPIGSPGSVSPSLQTIALLVNTFRHYGVPASHMHLAAMFHGPTIVLLADDATYRKRTGSPANPNKDLLNRLRQAGVQPMVCAQSAIEQHYDLDALSRTAQIDLSATITFINLQGQGYVKVEE